MFFTNGFKTVSVDDICLAIGIAKKTFYLLFSNKDELIQEVIQTAFADLYGNLQEELMPDDAVARLKLFDNHLLEFSKVFYPALIVDLKRYHHDAYQIFIERREKLITYLATILELGKRRGTFRKHLDSRILAELRFSELETIFSKRIELKLADWNRSQKELFDHYLAGLVLND
jgi:AcrR family transcriptional regulator